MKTPACVLVLLALPALAFAATIYPGEPGDDVKATLGPPPDARVSGDIITWYYSHGQVRLRNDRVIDSDFFSPNAVDAQQAADAADTGQHKAEGEALKAKTDADPNFAALLPASQVAFWEDFRRRYPEVSCDTELGAALAANAAQRKAAGEALKAKTDADPNFAAISPASQVDFWEDFRRRYPEVSCLSEYEAARAKQHINIGDSMGQVQFALGEAKSQAQVGDKLILYYRRGQVQFVDGHVVSSDLPMGPRGGFAPGDSFADVRAALGEPKSQEQTGNKAVWYYSWRRTQIMVQFVDGQVVSPAWQPPNDDESTSQAQTTTADANASPADAQHMAEGEALKARTLAVPGYAAMSPGDQLALWADFRSKYPEVSCDNEYNAALARWKSQQNRAQP